MLEYLKNVKRKCDCDGGLVWYRHEYSVRIRAGGDWLNDYAQLLSGCSKYKIKHRYKAECEICGKFYFSTGTKKDMIKNLKYLNFGYKAKG